MSKTILITGSTDGIGLATAKVLLAEGHQVLVHGRSKEKVDQVKKTLTEQTGDAKVEGYVADLSDMRAVKALASAIKKDHQSLDVLINNAGVYIVKDTVTVEGLERRFAVNTIAPFLLTQLLLPIMNKTGRILNLSSAAQASVNLKALSGQVKLTDGDAYAQSKLGITMWSCQLGREFKMEGHGPVVVAINPKSFLGSKMVKEAYGREGYDISIGADILCRGALSESFEEASGKYYDNDSERFTSPHPDALNGQQCKELIQHIEGILQSTLNK